MRVELRTQKGIPGTSVTGEARTQTRYQVVLMSRGREVVVDQFMSPGSFTDGFLSDTQAKTRAKEAADRLKAFLAEQGDLDAEEVVSDQPRRAARPKIASAYEEPRSFTATA